MKMGLAIAGIGLAKFETFASPTQGFLNKFTEDLPKQLGNKNDNM